MQVQVFKSRLSGSFEVPPSKSHSMRAIVLACFADGVSLVKNVLKSGDVETAISVFENLGCTFTVKRETDAAFDVEITPPKEGLADFIHRSGAKTCTIACGNSGTLLYFLAVIFSFCEKTFVFTGDDSLSQRPLAPLVELYEKRRLKFSTQEGRLPLTVEGAACRKSLHLALDGKFSQSISGLFLAAAIFGLELHVRLATVGEAPYLAMTRAWLEKAGFPFIAFELEKKYFALNAGGKKLSAVHATILSDWSAAAFPVLAALASGSTLEIALTPDTTQGDMKLVQFLCAFNARFRLTENALTVESNQNLLAAEIDCAETPDAIPALCAIASLARGTTEIKHVEMARYKETDRVKIIAEALSVLGVSIAERGDSIFVTGKTFCTPIHPVVESRKDHRIAMTLIALALGIDEPITVNDYEWYTVSFPNFLDELKKCGAKFYDLSLSSSSLM